MTDDDWTISTIKVFFEEKFKALNDHLDLRFDARDKALELQASDNKEHFDRLNHENARILKATEITVSRDTWDGFQKEFQIYKDQIEKALQGRTTATIVQIISSLGSLVSMIGVGYLLFK